MQNMENRTREKKGWTAISECVYNTDRKSSISTSLKRLLIIDDPLQFSENGSESMPFLNWRWIKTKFRA